MLSSREQTADYSANLNAIYEHIVEQSANYFDLYDIYSFRQKLADGYKRFVEFGDQVDSDGTLIKQKLLSQILSGLHANAKRESIPELGFTTQFGALTQTSGIVLPKDTVVIYQSISGLFERKVPLIDIVE